MSKDFSPLIKVLQEIVRKEAFEVYCVGGFLRDYLLGRDNNDLDFAVKKNALILAKIFADKIKGAYVLLDASRGCARVVKKEREGLYTFDFAEFRAETLIEDLAQRDFTINTLAVHLLDLKDQKSIEKNILDYKQGMKDLNARRIRRTSVTALRQDPLRMMRAFTLQASLDFRIDLSTLNQIRREASAICPVSVERVRDELLKILASPRAAKVLSVMDRVGLLSRVIPQITVMYHCAQGGYHHLDVWKHSLETVRQLEKIFQKDVFRFSDQDRDDILRYLQEKPGGISPRFALMKLAALLHDIGKPDTRQPRPQGGFSFYGHERLGRDIVRHVARMLKLSTSQRHFLEDMVFFHLRPGYLSNFKHPGRRMIFRYFRDTGKDALGVLLLSLADHRATRGVLSTRENQRHHQRMIRSLIQEYLAKKRERPFVPLLNGRDLITQLNLVPSPLFGRILSRIEEQQVLGKITTKKDALALAGRLVEQGL